MNFCLLLVMIRFFLCHSGPYFHLIFFFVLFLELCFFSALSFLSSFFFILVLHLLLPLVCSHFPSCSFHPSSINFLSFILIPLFSFPFYLDNAVVLVTPLLPSLLLLVSDIIITYLLHHLFSPSQPYFTSLPPHNPLPNILILSHYFFSLVPLPVMYIIQSIREHNLRHSALANSVTLPLNRKLPWTGRILLSCRCPNHFRVGSF